jgi:nicotinate-nucleotide adenylyltransferase
MGADQLLALPTWRQPEAILELARLAVVPRGSADPEELSVAAEDIAPGRVDWVLMPEIGISSSLIRRRMEDGLPIAHLVPATVERELRRAGLVASPASMEPHEGIESRRSS